MNRRSSSGSARSSSRHSSSGASPSAGSSISFRSKSALSLWGPVVAYMAVIFYVSSLHQPPLPPGVGDKPAHSFGYLWLGLVLARALAGGLPPRITLRQALIGLALASF